MRKPKILLYDIETSPMLAYVWSLGKQVVRHSQLQSCFDSWGIITCSYKWLGEKKVYTIDWGYEEQDTKKVLQEFIAIAIEADVIIGKNNKSFDDKMIAGLAMLHGVDCPPHIFKDSDDMQKQFRKHFRLPSQALDYISHKLGLGGKVDMKMQDWIDIVEKNSNGKKALDKMIKYNKKDVLDTEALWIYAEKYFTPKFKVNIFNDNPMGCPRCNSTNVRANGTRMSGGLKKQMYTCNDCGAYSQSLLSGGMKKV